MTKSKHLPKGSVCWDETERGTREEKQMTKSKHLFLREVCVVVQVVFSSWVSLIFFTKSTNGNIGKMT